MKKLIQEIYKGDEWKCMIGCIMLNQTNNVQVHAIICNFFDKYPTPQSILEAKQQDIVEEIRTLGLYNRRAKNIINFSDDWLHKKMVKNRRM